MGLQKPAGRCHRHPRSCRIRGVSSSPLLLYRPGRPGVYNRRGEIHPAYCTGSHYKDFIKRMTACTIGGANFARLLYRCGRPRLYNRGVKFTPVIVQDLRVTAVAKRSGAMFKALRTILPSNLLRNPPATLPKHRQGKFSFGRSGLPQVALKWIFYLLSLGAVVWFSVVMGA